MRRHLFLFTALIVVAGSAPAATAATAKPRFVKHTRTVVLPYSVPCTVTLFAAPAPGPSIRFEDACSDAAFGFVTTKNETFMSVVITDKTGQPVPALLQASGAASPTAVVCGQVKNMRVGARAGYTLTPAVSGGHAGCSVPATGGSIRVTLTNYRR